MESARSATAVFQPDTGLVRPDLAITLWDLCCGGVPLADHRTPDPATWGPDHGLGRRPRVPGCCRPRRRIRIDPARCPAPALGSGELVRNWIKARMGEVLARTSGATVVLDPDGVLDEHAITSVAEACRVVSSRGLGQSSPRLGS